MPDDPKSPTNPPPAPQRQHREMGSTHARAMRQFMEFREEPFLLNEKDKLDLLTAARAHKPVRVPFPMLGHTVPLAWVSHRYLQVPMDAHSREGREAVLEFVESLQPGRGYSVVAVDPEKHTALICEYTRVLQ